MITTERQAEIDAATVENPAKLNRLEVAELRLRNKKAFYEDVASKRLLLDENNTIRNLVTGANENGMSNAEIAAELGIAESSVRRLLTPRTHYDKALEKRTVKLKQLKTENVTTIELEPLTPERLQEIYNATVENPVKLTPMEYHALRGAHMHRFQADVGAGLFRLTATKGSPAARAFEMKNAGYSEAEIAEHLGMTPEEVRHMSAVTHAVES